MRGVGLFVAGTLAVSALVGLVGLTGCATMDRAYQQEVTWTNVPTVHVFTNTVVVTNMVPVVLERTNVVYVTNEATRAVAAFAEREPIATNFVTDDADERCAGVHDEHGGGAGDEPRGQAGGRGDDRGSWVRW